jgi:hypothetical protein
MAELEKANARFLLAIRSKLTPEQWKQLEADRANRPEKEWERDGGNPGGSHGQPPPPARDGQDAPAPPAGRRA